MTVYDEYDEGYEDGYLDAWADLEAWYNVDDMGWDWYEAEEDELAVLWIPDDLDPPQSVYT